jgi:hypothetical protein
MVFTLFKRRGRIAVLPAVAAAIALTLTLMALGGRGPAAAHAAVKHATKQSVTARDPDTLQVGDQMSPDPAGSAAKAAAANDPAGNSQAGGPDTSGANDPAGNSQAGGPDTSGANDPAGNSQAGGPDTSGANDPAGNSQAGGPDTSSTSGEPSVDSEQGLPGEPAVGHADPAGSAGSNCTGNCVQ